MESGDLKFRIETALVRGHLSQWQRQFLLDIYGRLEKHGPDIRLSEKQVDKLYEALKSARPRVQERSRPWSRRRRGPLEREARYFANRHIRTFGFALVLLVGSFIYSQVKHWPTYGTSDLASVVSDSLTPRPLARSEFTVTDGDTIRLKGREKGTRLVGFNAPESIEPRCAVEGRLGRRAKARLEELVASSKLELQMVACSCRPGTQGTNDCNYGRSCGSLFADGRDVGEVLISEGLAVPFVCGSTSCPPTPRPWCA